MVTILSTTPRIVMGRGSVKTVGTEVAAQGAERVLVVTDKGVLAAGLLRSVEDSLEAAKIGYCVFDEVESDPRYEIVAECVKMARNTRAQVLVGIGGGSPMDITKAAAIMLTNEGPIGAYFGVILFSASHEIPSQGCPLQVFALTLWGERRKIVHSFLTKDGVWWDSTLPPRRSSNQVSASAETLHGERHMEEEVGRVVGFFQKISVAAIEITQGELNVGDAVHIKGHTTDCQQRIVSMQKEKVAITTARPGDQIGIKVASPVREHDIVFKVSE